MLSKFIMEINLIAFSQILLKLLKSGTNLIQPPHIQVINCHHFCDDNSELTPAQP